MPSHHLNNNVRIQVDPTIHWKHNVQDTTVTGLYTQCIAFGVNIFHILSTTLDGKRIIVNKSNNNKIKQQKLRAEENVK